MVVLVSFFSEGGFTTVVLLSFLSAGGLTVVVFCSQAANKPNIANRQMYFFIPPDSCPGAKFAASALTIHASDLLQITCTAAQQPNAPA